MRRWYVLADGEIFARYLFEVFGSVGAPGEVVVGVVLSHHHPIVLVHLPQLYVCHEFLVPPVGRHWPLPALVAYKIRVAD